MYDLKHELAPVDKREVKRIITVAVRGFHEKHREEAELFYQYVREKRGGLHNDMGDTGGDHAIERALFEMPVGLYEVLMKTLKPEQMIWFNTKEGSRWFAKNFQAYSLLDSTNI